jgi:hypothetical protein
VTPEEADKAQDWRSMDGATAWHLIDRHAENWNEVGELMAAWLRAHVLAEREVCAKPQEPVAVIMPSWMIHFVGSGPIAPLIEKHGLKIGDFLFAHPAPTPDGWRQIETAPTVGRELILLLTPSRFPQVAYSNTWWTCGFSVENKPTHWMPLPDAPSTTTKDAAP